MINVHCISQKLTMVSTSESHFSNNLLKLKIKYRKLNCPRVCGLGL